MFGTSRTRFSSLFCWLSVIALSHWCVAVAVAQDQSDDLLFDFQVQQVSTDSSLRGLCVVDAKTVWATGSKGAILRTIDGENWESLQIPNRAEVEIRDVFAWNSLHALVMIAGQPAEIWETEDGGGHWKRVFVDPREKAFLDDIWIDPKTGEGLAFGDVVHSAIPLVKREADGRWHLWEDLAELSDLPGIHGYAASGTSMIRLASGRFLLGTGGSKDSLGQSTVLISDAENWRRWRQTHCQIAATESAGIFSMAADGQNVIAVGGDYLKPDDRQRVAVFSSDGGETWKNAESMPKGFRSGVALVQSTLKGSVFICVGTNGSDVSFDSGIHWQPVNDINLNAVRFDEEKNGWAVGGKGAVYRIVVTSR